MFQKEIDWLENMTKDAYGKKLNYFSNNPISWVYKNLKKQIYGFKYYNDTMTYNS